MTAYKKSPRVERRERITKAAPTGVPGISFFRTAAHRKDGTVQAFFAVHIKTHGRHTSRKFCISTQGKETAWRKAVALRAVYEREVAASRAQYRAAKGAL